MLILTGKAISGNLGLSGIIGDSLCKLTNSIFLPPRGSVKKKPCPAGPCAAPPRYALNHAKPCHATPDLAPPGPAENHATPRQAQPSPEPCQALPCRTPPCPVEPYHEPRLAPPGQAPTNLARNHAKASRAGPCRASPYQTVPGPSKNHAQSCLAMPGPARPSHEPRHAVMAFRIIPYNVPAFWLSWMRASRSEAWSLATGMWLYSTTARPICLTAR